MKSSGDILDMFLLEKFQKELEEGNVVASDQVQYYTSDSALFEQLYHKWLVKKGYAVKEKGVPEKETIETDDVIYAWFMKKYDVPSDRMGVVEHEGHDVIRFIKSYLEDRSI